MWNDLEVGLREKKLDAESSIPSIVCYVCLREREKDRERRDIYPCLCI